MKILLEFKDGMIFESGSFDRDGIDKSENFLPGMLKVKYENKDITLNGKVTRKGKDLKGIKIEFED